MPRRDDIKSILIIGSGPIVIGQACEFDYSGTQACKALREECYRIVLVNSNPATIMTDPEFADRTYIEPISPEVVAKIIEAEHGGSCPIDALLPTIGGQTALNTACQLFDAGVLDRFGVEMIGASREVIYRAEDRDQFKKIIESIGLRCPRSGIATAVREAFEVLGSVGLPAIIRPAFTLGGTGGGVAYNREEFEDIVRRGLDASMAGQILIDQSLIGWKEYELEVMRDCDDNAVIICSIENFDPMGVHTGDSITVAPAQTLTDKEYQRMRDAAMAIIRAVGVETGGSNIQFAVNPADGEMVVIEMNPRVSRSSALASKATGFPIAKIAAKLAVGYTLWELSNDITAKTAACFEPTIDYVVTKIPRWTFEKFPDADQTLTTQMKSVGEAMSIGRTFKESLQKGIRSMEVKRFGLGLDANDHWLNASQASSRTRSASLDPAAEAWPIDETKLSRKLSIPSQGRLYYIRYAFKLGWSVDKVFEASKIDPWFLDQIKQLVDFEQVLVRHERLGDVPPEVLFEAKQLGYSDPQLANLYYGRISTETILKVRAHRKRLGIEPVYKLVDTCAAEFEATTPYYYSTYEAPIHQIEERGAHSEERQAVDEGNAGQSRIASGDSLFVRGDDEIRVTERPKIIILGGGPNRIGQGIEFDYCCVQAAFALREMGYEAVMVNSNPETVSTDYDTSDLLFFEPLTLEDVLNLCERLNGGAFGQEGARNLVRGVIVQFGGQTPLNLAHGLKQAGVPIVGTPVDSIDLAEDRRRFSDLLRRLGVRQPANGIAHSVDEAIEVANRISYPVLVRPSFVLGGRAMETVFDDDQLRQYMKLALGASDLEGQPILVDKFLFQAIECDVDVIADYGAESRPCDDLSSGPGLGRLAVSSAERAEDSGAVPGFRNGPERPSATLNATVADRRPQAIICGVMEHIEEAGVHSGDSACAVPPHSLSVDVIQRIKDQSRQLAEALDVRGLMNVQFAIRMNAEQAGADPACELYVLEVNPRASRTVPFISKATGVPWARLAASVMAGHQLCDLPLAGEVTPRHSSVKESVFPFNKFPGVDVILGPEMRSTGEVMGIDLSFPIAYAKSQMAAGVSLPMRGRVFLSVRDSDKAAVVPIARDLVDMGFEVLTTAGTHSLLREHRIETRLLRKISEGHPNAVDLIKNGELALIINTPTRKGAGSDEGRLRAMAVRFNVPMITTLTAATVASRAIAALRTDQWGVRALQDYFPDPVRPRKG